MQPTNTLTKLVFGYPSNAKIRIKICNVYENDAHPHIYLIKTEKLEFTIPKKQTIKTQTHVYIPNQIYQEELNKFYHKIDNIKK